MTGGGYDRWSTRAAQPEMPRRVRPRPEPLPGVAVDPDSYRIEAWRARRVVGTEEWERAKREALAWERRPQTDPCAEVTANLREMDRPPLPVAAVRADLKELWDAVDRVAQVYKARIPTYAIPTLPAPAVPVPSGPSRPRKGTRHPLDGSTCPTHGRALRGGQCMTCLR